MDSVECILCAEPCVFMGIFECGHATCGMCALRILVAKQNEDPTTTASSSNSSKVRCPVCRHPSAVLHCTREAPPCGDDDDVTTTYDMTALLARSKTNFVLNRALGTVRVEGAALNEYIDRLHAYVCPVPGCWKAGEQEPFALLDALRDHLRTEHGVDYCSVCLDHRKAFLVEQHVYTDGERHHHVRGACSRDGGSFTGHPQCAFCPRSHFYDGEHLLKHAQKNHYTCDLCNAGEYIFTFYKNRDKLLQHFSSAHKLCTHADCARMDPMLRVYRNDFEYQAHMQRAHGASGGPVSLDSLGFRFGGGGGGNDAFGGGNNNNRRSGGGGGGGNANASQHVQSGSNVVATHITFDHVNRIERIELEPTQRRCKQSSVSSTLSALPKHYLPPRLMFRPIQHRPDGPNDGDGADGGGIGGAEHYPHGNDEAAANHHAADDHHGHATGDAAPGTGTSRSSRRRRNRHGGKQDGDDDGDEHASRAAQHASAVRRHDADSLKALVPKDAEARRRMLLEALTENIPKAPNHAEVSEIMEAIARFNRGGAGGMMATELFKLISKHLPREDLVSAVFPLVVANVQATPRQESLLTAREMLTCAEYQRLERSRAEADEKRLQDERLRQLNDRRLEAARSTTASRKGQRGGGGNGGGQRMTVWGTSTSTGGSGFHRPAAGPSALASLIGDTPALPSTSSSPPSSSPTNNNNGKKKKTNNSENTLGGRQQQQQPQQQPQGRWISSSAAVSAAAAAVSSPTTATAPAPPQQQQQQQQSAWPGLAPAQPQQRTTYSTSNNVGIAQHSDPSAFPELGEVDSGGAVGRWSSSAFSKNKPQPKSSNPWFKR